MVEAMTLHPLDINREFVAAARDGGLNTEALRVTGGIGFHFNLMNRLADAFDFTVPDAKQKLRMARMLNLAGRRLGDSPTPPPADPGPDGRIRPREIAQTRTNMLTNPGVTEPSLRFQVDRFVRNAWELPGYEDATVPEAYAAYLTKLARHAYRITNEDMDGLRNAGLSDEGIYEVTATAAVSSASVGIEQLYAVLFDGAKTAA